jgi:hypothetical protein
MTRHQTHRLTDVLDSITQSYNNSFHRSIKMTPRAVTKNDERGCGNFNTVLELNWIVNRLLDSRLRKGILDAYLLYVSLSTGNTTSVGRWNTSWWIIIQSPCVVPTNYPPRSRKDHRRSSPILTRATNRARI